MNLQTIIDAHEAGTLPDMSDTSLEVIRLEVEAAATQARDRPGLKPLHNVLKAIDTSITKTLNDRYGCND